MNLRARVVIAFVAAAVFILAINVILGALLDRDVNANFDYNLQNTANSILSKVGTSDLSQQVGALTLYDVVAITTTVNGAPKLALAGPPTGQAAFAQLPSKTTAASTNINGWRFFKATTTNHHTTVVIGESLTSVSLTTSRIMIEIIILAVTTLFILAILSIWVISIGIRPLASIAAVARSIAGGARGTKVDLDRYLASTEVGDVAAALNEMSTSLEGHITREQEINTEMRQLLGDVGHELRTPLTSISGYTQLLLSGALEPKDRDEALERVIAESGRMSRLVESLLQLARMEVRTGMHYEYFDVVQVIRDLIADHQVIDATRIVELTGVPELSIEADYDQLSGMIANLLVNLRVHTPSGTSATINIDSTSEYMIITYKDTGPGVSDPDLLFKRFWRSPGTTAPGSGLGMAIVYGAVRAHQGTIKATSSLGRGLRLTMQIPLVASENNNEA